MFSCFEVRITKNQVKAILKFALDYLERRRRVVLEAVVNLPQFSSVSPRALELTKPAEALQLRTGKI